MVLLDVTSDPFFIYKSTLRISGIWPLDGLKPGSLILYVIIALFEVAGILTNLVHLSRKCAASDIADDEVMTLVLWLITSATMRLSFRLYCTLAIPLIESTIEDWSLITEPTERMIMKRHDKLGAIIWSTLFLGFIVYPSVIDIVSLAFPSILPSLDHRLSCADNDDLTFGISIFTEAMNLFECISTCSCILLFWSLAMHLCGQYQILKQQFKEFLLIEDREKNRREFRRLIERHNHLINLSCKLEDSFNAFLAVVLSVIQCSIFFYAFQLIYGIKDADLLRMAEAFAVCSVSIGSLFLYFNAGEYLTSCGEEIGEVLIQCNWYDLPKEKITNFGIVIVQSRNPRNLTAAKFYTMNRSNLKPVLQATYSYVSLVVWITSN